MNVAVIGSGYVGLVTGACLAEVGHKVVCADISEEKISCLNKGECPIFEPGLQELFQKNSNEKKLFFTTNVAQAIKDSQIIFIAVGTPSNGNGEADLKYVESVAKTIGENLNEYKVIVDKSTVPVGTAKRVAEIINENAKQNNSANNNSILFDVVSNPEFLKEGDAINDFRNPDRIIIGTESEKARKIMLELYSALCSKEKIFFTKAESAELIKYASNAMLALRISFINEIAVLSEKVGADIIEVSNGVGADTRIGSKFLNAGIGYGGSCFPKDVKALVHTMKETNSESAILEAVEEVNFIQKRILLPKVKQLVPELKGKKIAVLGLAFKPNTDDVRESPSFVVIEQLQKEGALVSAFDPQAIENSKKELRNVNFCDSTYEAITGSDCVVLVTEWKEFKELDLVKAKSLMAQPNFVDGRNVFNPSEMKKIGFNYLSVGR